jgi:8-oxo-dGTP pyrophosphatase MutT (NUDIX family)
MGAGLLPTAIHNNKLYFLFGKENKYEDTSPGWADFGGGTDNNETLLETSIREGTEELTGFIGSSNDIKQMINKSGTYNVDYVNPIHKFGIYRTHILPYKYEPLLPYYYNNNQRFLQKKLDPKVIKSYRIFEKEEIRWVCIDDLLKMKPQFRNFYQNIIMMLQDQKTEIFNFIKKRSNKTRRRKLNRKLSRTLKRNK